MCLLYYDVPTSVNLFGDWMQFMNEDFPKQVSVSMNPFQTFPCSLQCITCFWHTH